MEEKLFNFKISDELREKIRLEAFERRSSLSKAVRDILEEYFKQKECKKKN